MEEILAITNLFVVEPTPRIREELFSVIATVNANALKRPLQDWVIKALKNFPTSDVVICDVTVGGNDPVSFRSGDWDSVAAALETLDELQRAAGPVAPCEVVLRIEKKLKANSISLYSIAALHAGLSGLWLKSLFSLFSKLLEANSEIVFRCLEPGLDFRTRTLHFTSAIDSQSATHGDRSKILERRSELCHFENAAEMKVLPSDFHLEKRSTKTEWDSLFDRLCTVLSIVYLSDVAFFRGENTVQFKLKGYKTLSGEIKWEEVTADAAEILFKVFEWVYEGGVAHDKMGIARNLISLHVTDSQMMNVDMGLIHSIQSGYQIYLRDNVKQYIELKNKLIEFVNDLSKKAAEQGKALSESLAKNFTAFSSFLLSVVIVKAISQKDFTGELSPRVAYIGYALLTASAIHLVISVYLMNRELKAMEDSYERMRGRYSDLLAPQDVQQAFDDHYDYRQAMQNIRWKRNLYALAWALYIVLFTFLIAKLQTSDTAVIGSVPSVSAPSNDTTSIQMSATTISNTNSSNVIPLLDGTPIIPRISNTGPASATTP